MRIQSVDAGSLGTGSVGDGALGTGSAGDGSVGTGSAGGGAGEAGSVGDGATELRDAAVLFDAYRVHYGASADVGRTTEWLLEQLTAGRLLVWVAYVEGVPVGMVTVTPMPASIALAIAWSIRDLFVVPQSRGGGRGEALLRHVIAAATDAGAARIGLQTETDNPAVRLYRRVGFEPIDGYVGLGLSLRAAP